MILKNPNCPSCSDYGYSPGTGAPTGVVPSGPGEAITDRVKIQLLAGVAKQVSFANISVLDDTKWTFSGKPWAYNSDNETVEMYTIYNKTGTGFTVISDVDCTFETLCIKL